MPSHHRRVRRLALPDIVRHFVTVHALLARVLRSAPLYPRSLLCPERDNESCRGRGLHMKMRWTKGKPGRAPCSPRCWRMGPPRMTSFAALDDEELWTLAQCWLPTRS
ncbi:hypothetical protein CTA2_13133 [Colletotrichum tanaceti]|nr:hypothetical protein CTA2_13133 [Colletotrichum tanaceti]